MPDLKGKHKSEEPDVKAEIETKEDYQNNADDEGDRTIMVDGMVDPVKGSKEIQGAGEHPGKKGSPRTLVPEGEHEGDKGDPCEGEKIEGGKGGEQQEPGKGCRKVGA
jgi:hypothetical protein